MSSTGSPSRAAESSEESYEEGDESWDDDEEELGSELDKEASSEYDSEAYDNFDEDGSPGPSRNVSGIGPPAPLTRSISSFHQASFMRYDEDGGLVDEAEDGGDSAVGKLRYELQPEETRRLTGAFLINAERPAGGVDHLPTAPAECLKKFGAIVASLGLSMSQDQLKADFDGVVAENKLQRELSPRSSTGRGGGEKDKTPAPIVGFTYKVFEQYYINKMQRHTREEDIKKAWEDLHRGTGHKMHQGKEYIARKDLHTILTTQEETLTDEEAQEMMRECKPDDKGRITYEGYRRMLVDASL